MNYFKKTDGEVYAFDDNQIHLVTKDMIKMTDDEIDKHINPHKYYTDEQKRALLRPLTKRQFSLYLFDTEKYDQVMDAINANPRFKIEFDVVANIERLSPTVSTMAELLGWSNEEIDVMWEQAALL